MRKARSASGLTACAMKGDAERILAAGYDGHLAKPLGTRTLPAHVSRTALARKLRDALHA